MLGIRPQQLAHDALLRRLSVPLDAPQVLDGDLVAREQAAVHHEHSAVEEMAERQKVVALCEHITHGIAVFRGDFAEKAIHLIHVDRLVVAAAHVEVIWKEQLEAEQRENALDAERASVDEVAVEQIRISLRWKTVFLENIQQVVELSVDVAAHCELSVVGYFNIYE